MPTTQLPQTYNQGHHSAVTANHATRTASVEAAFLLPHLPPSAHILDLGCGPGTITSSLAAYVPHGSATGIDLSPAVIQQAEALLAQRVPTPTNVRFAVGDVLSGLDVPDGKFDAVFCHQFLLHVPEPVRALCEMRRVCRPGGGIVAAREADWPFRWHPLLPGLELWMKYLYMLVHGATDRERPYDPPFPPGHRGGSLVHVWAREAGFDPGKMEKGAKVTLYRTEEERRAYAGMMVGRLVEGGHGARYKELGASDEDIETMIVDLKRWADNVDGWHAIMQCEVICRT